MTLAFLERLYDEEARVEEAVDAVGLQAGGAGRGAVSGSGGVRWSPEERLTRQASSPRLKRAPGVPLMQLCVRGWVCQSVGSTRVSEVSGERRTGPSRCR